MITNPKGIDLPIQRMQQYFIENLWTDVSDDKKQFNHRVFKNIDRKGNLVPEIYVSNNEYKEVKFNDSLSILSWFDVSNNQSELLLGANEKTVGIFFCVNLNDLYPELQHRAIEEAHRDALIAITKFQTIFKRPYSLIEGREAYDNFNIANLKHPDMQPWHVFKIEGIMKYNFKC